MLVTLNHWIAKRRQIRKLWQSDARRLASEFGRSAFYEAQRRAARARFSGDGDGFVHWAKVASEVARISPIAEMDFHVVRRIVEEEHARAQMTDAAEQ